MFCSFLWLGGIPLGECPHLLIHSPVGGSLAYIPFGAIMSKAAIDILVPVFCGHVFLFLLSKYVMVAFLSQRVGVGLI